MTTHFIKIEHPVPPTDAINECLPVAVYRRKPARPLPNQFVSQTSDEIRDAVLGNVGTLVVFRVGPADAALLSREFAERFTPLDLMSLPNHRIYVRLMIDGAPSAPFSAATLAPSDPLIKECS